MKLPPCTYHSADDECDKTPAFFFNTRRGYIRFLCQRCMDSIVDDPRWSQDRPKPINKDAIDLYVCQQVMET